MRKLTVGATVAVAGYPIHLERGTITEMTKTDGQTTAVTVLMDHGTTVTVPPSRVNLTGLESAKPMPKLRR